MKREKEFDNILDECLERILARGETVEKCLARYPELAAELEPLLQTALSTKETLAIKPRPEFRERARYQLRTALQEMEEKRQRRFAFFNWQPQWVTAVVAVLVLLLASSGTVAAAGNSMPDGTLYPVKLATEKVRLVLTPSTLGKAEMYAKLADKRVTEIVNMADKGKLEQVERTTQRLNAQLVAMASLVGAPEEGATVLTAPAPSTATQEAAAPVTEEPPEEEKIGVVLAPAPPSAAKEAPAVAEEAQEAKPGAALAPAPTVAKEPPRKKEEVQVAPVQPVPEEAPAISLVPSVVSEEAPVPQPVPSERAEPAMDKGKADKRAELMVLVARNAVKHPEALRKVLQKVPESARPALLRAIAASDAEYEKILQALREKYEEDDEEDEEDED
jgi:predicted pyridoxine 5'-phosphate oxidase superfamily flavin-nucleotide-binding protein